MASTTQASAPRHPQVPLVETPPSLPPLPPASLDASLAVPHPRSTRKARTGNTARQVLRNTKTKPKAAGPTGLKDRIFNIGKSAVSGLYDSVTQVARGAYNSVAEATARVREDLTSFTPTATDIAIDTAVSLASTTKRTSYQLDRKHPRIPSIRANPHDSQGSLQQSVQLSSPQTTRERKPSPSGTQSLSGERFEQRVLESTTRKLPRRSRRELRT